MGHAALMRAPASADRKRYGRLCHFISPSFYATPSAYLCRHRPRQRTTVSFRRPSSPMIAQSFKQYRASKMPPAIYAFTFSIAPHGDDDAAIGHYDDDNQIDTHLITYMASL